MSASSWAEFCPLNGHMTNVSFNGPLWMLPGIYVWLILPPLRSSQDQVFGVFEHIPKCKCLVYVPTLR